MRDEQGREVVVRLLYPLPMDLAGRLMTALGTCMEESGYTDVVLTGNGDQIAGTPPPPGWRRPDDLDEYDDDVEDDEHPHGGPPAAEGGAPTAPTT